jgi:hypothetical protein
LSIGAIGAAVVARRRSLAVSWFAATAAAGEFAITTSAPSVPTFAASIRSYLADRHLRRPLVRADQEQWWLAAAILAELDREGVAFAVEEDWARKMPS